MVGNDIKLIILRPLDYKKSCQEMYEHTKNECSNNCRVPRTCCAPEYCEMARKFALDFDGTVLEETGHETLPFMGPNGCTISPHFRLLCTLHVCSINGFGHKPGDPEWTEKYFKLRDEIENYIG